MARILGMVAALLTFVLASFVAGKPALAQDPPAWIQLESLPDLASAEARARDYAASLGQVAGFRLGSKWYVLAAGPFAPAEAAGKMAALKSAGQIPRDAYITDGSDHGAQFWPAGAGATTAASETAPAATTEPPAPPTLEPAAAPADETQEQAAASEAALPREDKAKLQAGLQWYGFYDGKLDGSFGRGTRASMAAWQTAMGYEPTGVLTTLQRTTLLTNYQAEEAAFGFEPITEPEAGIEITLPAAMLAFDHYEPPFVHYAAKNGSNLRLLLISEPGDETTLAGLYDLLQSLEVVPAGGERALDNGEFTINAASDTVASFATARASKGAIKGFLLVWDPAQNDMAQRALGVMRASWRSTGDQVLDPGLVPLDETVKSGVLAGMAVKAPNARLSGAYVDATGLVLTSAVDVASCGKITLDGGVQAEVVATDAALGAAVLRPLSALSPIAVARLAATSAPVGTAVTIAGYSIEIGLPAPVITKGSIVALGGPNGEAGLLTLAANVTKHDVGGPVLDGTGALVGMVQGGDLGGKTLPQGTALALDVASLAALIAQAGGAATVADAAASQPLTPDALNAAAMGMTVQVACWP